eukprot:286699-Pelagomonas_calceolata.AAC.3
MDSAQHSCQPPEPRAPQQVGLKALGRLQRHLDAVLQDGDREVGAGHGRQPQPEVLVHLVGLDALHNTF